MTIVQGKGSPVRLEACRHVFSRPKDNFPFTSTQASGTKQNNPAQAERGIDTAPTPLVAKEEWVQCVLKKLVKPLEISRIMRTFAAEYKL